MLSLTLSTVKITFCVSWTLLGAHSTISGEFSSSGYLRAQMSLFLHSQHVQNFVAKVLFHQGFDMLVWERPYHVISFVPKWTLFLRAPSRDLCLSKYESLSTLKSGLVTAKISVFWHYRFTDRTSCANTVGTNYFVKPNTKYCKRSFVLVGIITTVVDKL